MEERAGKSRVSAQNVLRSATRKMSSGGKVGKHSVPLQGTRVEFLEGRRVLGTVRRGEPQELITVLPGRRRECAQEPLELLLAWNEEGGIKDFRCDEALECDGFLVETGQEVPTARGIKTREEATGGVFLRKRLGE